MTDCGCHVDDVRSSQEQRAVLGLGVLLDTGRRALGESEPVGWIMIASASASLVVNLVVLRLLAPFRKGEVHLRASWIFTRADVIANVGVIAAALLVIVTASNIPDLIVGVAIGGYVIKEAIEILRDARDTQLEERSGEVHDRGWEERYQ